MRLIVAAFALLSMVSTAQAEIRLKPITCPMGGDAGFRVIGAHGEDDGVDAEYQWLAAERPDWSRANQSTIQDGGRIFDVLDIEKGAQKQSICFDITDFFGKMQ
jgi:hypothetical protein